MFIVDLEDDALLASGEEEFWWSRLQGFKLDYPVERFPEQAPGSGNGEGC